MPCQVARLGLVDYQATLALQRRLAAARGNDDVQDTLLLLEHPHTYTLGSAASRANLLLDDAECLRRQISVYDVDRGGDITYHGPGQLVGYPILKLPAGSGAVRADVVAYIRNIEQVIIDTLVAFGLNGERLPGFSGVWLPVDGELAKIAAVGVKVTTRRVTYHGFALNVNTDMSYFAGIVPCGIVDKPVVSMQQVIGTTIPLRDVEDTVINAFARVFDGEMKLAESLTNV